LLAILAQADGAAMEVPELMSASGMSLSRFAEALTSVKLGGFVEVSGDPEVAQLTAKGQEVAALARPA
jgi:hypothetical protein